MIGLRLALGAIAVMAVMTAGVGSLAILDYQTPSPDRAMVLLAGGDSAYWRALVAGAQEAADEQGIDLSVCWPPSDQNHAGRLQTIGASQYAASCGGASGRADCLFHVGEAHFRAGARCAELAASLVSAGEPILVLIEEEPPTSPQSGRLQGFKHALRSTRPAGADPQNSAHPITVERIPADESPSARQQRIAAAITRCSSRIVVDLTFGEAAHLAAAASQLEAPPQLITLDQSAAALELVELGKIAAIVAHDPHLCGYLAVDRLAFFQIEGPLACPAVGKGHVFVPPVVVRPGEVAEFRASLKQAE